MPSGSPFLRPWRPSLCRSSSLPVRPQRHGLPVRGRGRVDHGPQLQDGRRWHFDPFRDADDLHDAAGHLASWDVQTRVKEYMIAFLMLETLMLGVFMALDLVLFYLFFEAGLIPMFLIIGIWGGAEPHLCELQVLPLHLPWLGPDAGGDGGHVCRMRARRIFRGLLTHEFNFETFSLLGIQIVGGLADAAVPVAFFASLPSRCRCGRCIPGCRTHTFRRQRPVRSCWRRSF